MIQKPLLILAEWDDEANVWVATSDDVPGLATEEVTMENLIKKLKIMILELLAANGKTGNFIVPFEVLARSFEIAESVNA